MNNMLSKEQLEKIANPGQADIGGAQNPIVTEMATELLSLREQLAELKALEPVAWTDAVELRGMAKDGCGYLFKVNPANPYIDPRRQIMLFTAAKPNALPRHIFSMLVNELRDVPAIGCKRQLIIGALNRHGVIAEPVGD
ncbi:hypothetical protein WFK89_15385 [Yersinia enterocolitica]|uniref:hypothetical protein n=1 Tax=Yersinia enterocolitica TaxID=630 RepID=UPI0021E85063|nr:hypothetical protein [Yersinia enterocolitica]UYJ99042.1 hypothetical protein N4W06_08325 [Yersinia enterocolitica]